MKKLTIALAVVAMAAFANAASFDWKTAKSGGAVYGPSTGSVLDGGTAYLFLASSAESILNDWVGGKALAEMTYLDSNTLSSAGKIANKTPFDSSEDPLNAIFATVVKIDGKDYLYISTVASADAVDNGSATLQFKETAASSGSILDAANGYKGAGWYSTAAVPEPTGAMLLVLGVAALALRRKQK